MLTRRFILFSGAACLAGGTGLGSLLSETARQAHAASDNFPFALDDDEWRKRLTAQQYAILRKHGTERPYSSALNNEKRRGVRKNCFRPQASMTAAPAGRASGCRFAKRPWAKAATRLTAWCAPKFTAPIAEGIWGMSSMTARHPPACATV